MALLPKTLRMWLDADPGAIVCGHLGNAREDDRRVGQVFSIVVARWKNVGRVRERGQGGERDAMGGADGGFEHAADPARHAGAVTRLVDRQRHGQAANAARFDVDVAAGLPGKRLLGLC